VIARNVQLIQYVQNVLMNFSSQKQKPVLPPAPNNNSDPDTLTNVKIAEPVVKYALIMKFVPNVSLTSNFLTTNVLKTAKKVIIK